MTPNDNDKLTAPERDVPSGVARASLTGYGYTVNPFDWGIPAGRVHTRIDELRAQQTDMERLRQIEGTFDVPPEDEPKQFPDTTDRLIVLHICRMTRHCHGAVGNIQESQRPMTPATPNMIGK